MHRAIVAIVGIACATSVVLAIGVTTALAAPPSASWAVQAGGAGDEWDSESTVLADGSVIDAGSYTSPATFGSLTASAAGANRAYVAKADPLGTWTWLATATSTNALTIRGIEALADGSSIVSGAFGGTVTLGPYTLSSVKQCVFVAKISASGTWLWATQASCSVDDWNAHYYGSVSTLPDGSAIVATVVEGTMTFGSASVTSASNGDVAVAKIDASGTWVWASRAGGTSDQFAYDVSALPDGSAVVVGTFRGANSAFGATTLVSSGQGDIFAAKISAAGAWEWAIRGGGTGNDGYDSVSVSPLQDGSSVVTATFGDGSDFGTATLHTADGSPDAMVGRVTAAGAWGWVLSVGDVGWQGFYGIQAQSDGSVLLSGCSQASLTIGSDLITVPSSAMVPIFARLNPDQTWAWATSGQGVTNSYDCSTSIGSTRRGQVRASGNFTHTMTIGSTTLTTTSVPAKEDIYIVAFDDASHGTGEPDAPQSVSASTPATGSNATSVSFTAPSGNGSPILSYAATCTSSTGGASASQTGAASPLTVSGLTPGATYTCTVTATNAVGTSAASAASASITVPNAAAGGPTSAAISAAALATGAAETAATPKLRLTQVASTAQGAVVIFTAATAGRATLVGTLAHGNRSSSPPACTAAKRVRRAGLVKLVCALRSDLLASSAGSRLTLVTTFTPTGGTAVSSKRTITLRGDSPMTAPPPTG